MVLLILGLLMFIGLVVIHEFGHFIMAKRNGVTVEEFGLGFPPRLYKRKTKGGWLFTINLLPLGGFVRMKGEHDNDTEKGTFGAASLAAKTKIMAAGVVMNLITAFVILLILAVAGMPKLVDNQFTVASDTKVVRNDIIISFVEKGSPAEKAGLKAGDRLRAIGLAEPNGQVQMPETDVASSQQLTARTKSFAGQKVSIRYDRDGKSHDATTTIRSATEVTASQKTNSPKGYLGVAPTDYTIQRSTWSAPIVAGGLIGQFTQLTFEGLGKALAGVGKIVAGAFTGNTKARQNGQVEASSQVSGPLGIFVILKDGSSLGLLFVLMIIAIISLTLAIMNILPIPALDGGRLWLTLIFHGLKKPLTNKVEERITATGFLFLMGLIILITVVDARRFF